MRVRLWSSGRVLLALVVWLWASAGFAQGFEQGRTAHYRFEWRPGLEAPTKALMSAVEAHHTRIYEALGVEPTGMTTVTVLEDAERMLEEAARRHNGHTPPEWAEGLAYPTDREIYLHASEPLGALDVTFQHEISHVALGAVGGSRVPTWLHEGIAIRLSEGFAMERAWLLTEAATMDALLDLDDLSRGFPASGPRAGIAYAQAVHFVGYLEGTYGADRMRALLQRLHTSDDTLREAVRSVYGAALGEIESDWRKGLRIWWGWVPVVFGSTAMWIGAATLLILAWRRRSRERAARMQAMRLIEAAEMAEMAVDIEIRHDIEPPRSMFDPYDGRPPTFH